MKRILHRLLIISLHFGSLLQRKAVDAQVGSDGRDCVVQEQQDADHINSQVTPKHPQLGLSIPTLLKVHHQS